jgi:putative ABC transport system permease protein
MRRDMETLLQDIRYGWRMLAKNPGFAVVAVLTLAVGIGANTAIFSVVNAIMVRNLPYANPHQLVLLWGDEQKGKDHRDQLSYTDVDDYRAQSQVFENVAAFGTWNAVFSGVGTTPERVAGMQVADGYLGLMGGKPMLGRDFLPEEQVDGKDQVVILGYGLWQSRFGGDPQIVGKKITLSARPYTVVGVMPKEFPFLPASVVDGPAQFYRPVAEKHDDKERRSRHLRAVARLKRGTSVDRAQAELNVINRRLAQQFPDDYATVGVRVVGLQDDIASGLRPALIVLLGAIGFLLLIACANVSNLLLARATVREKEMAVRVALGADHWRLVRQALTESVLLALGGGALGILLAFWGTGVITSIGANVIPQLAGVQLDWRVLTFTAAISVATWLLFGLVPALQASSVALHQTLKEGGRTHSVAHGNLRKFLAVTEMALALVLLAGAGLLLRTFSKLSAVDPGFRTDHVLTMEIGLPSAKYPAGTAKPAIFYRELLAKISALPGVESAAAVSILPLGADFDTVGIDPEGLTYGPGEQPYPERYVVTPDYLKTLAIGIVRGRGFSDADDENAPLVAVVSETAAQSWWPNRDPIGRRIRVPGFEKGTPPWRTVVGVVRDVKQSGLDAPRTMQVYLAHPQYSNGYLTLVVRTKQDPLNLVAQVRQQVQNVDPDQAVSNIASMDQVLSNSVASRRFTAVLLGILAAIGLLLASVGVYGILSYGVSQRTREIGIRMALGAAQRDVLSLIVGQGLKLLMLGLGAGMLAALVLTRLMSGLLFGVSASDPVTFSSIALFLGAVALVACYLPARQAARVDPMVALRHE